MTEIFEVLNTQTTREVNKNNLLGVQFLIFLPKNKKTKQNKKQDQTEPKNLGGQLSIMSALNQYIMLLWKLENVAHKFNAFIC